MSQHDPINQVLKQTAQLLDQPDAAPVGDQQVWRALGWSVARQAEVRVLLAQLIEDDALRGPRSGPLRGDNQLLTVDVLGVTPQGRQRLGEATRPGWRRVWRSGGRPAARQMWAIVVLVIGGALGTALYMAAHLRGFLP